MAVPIYTRPDMTSQSGTTYRANIDGAVQAFERAALSFFPQAQATPDMTVRLLAGYVMSGSTLTEVAAQNTGTITAPVSNPRIDRVVVDAATGAVSVVTGTEAGSPSAPAIPLGKLPVCRFQLATSTTAITNSMIVDERVSAGSAGPLSTTVRFAAASRILGRKTAGAGAGEELTLSDILDMIGSPAQGDILYRGASGWVRLPAGTSGQFLKTLGAGADPAWATAGGMSVGSPVSLSGTSVDFTGIPSGKKRITLCVSQGSTNGTSDILVQLGKSAGVETSGYYSAGSRLTSIPETYSSTSGFIIRLVGASRDFNGLITFQLMDATNNIWAASGGFTDSTIPQAIVVSGKKALAGTLDRVRLTTVGGDSFDAGTGTIIMEE